jgi:tRNA(fMet)-specific endonuclease VapC
VAPFDAPAGRAYGPIRRAARESRTDRLDRLIAAHAVSLGARLVTNRAKDFAGYPGVSM